MTKTMARAIRMIFPGLAALACLVWIGGYLYVSGLACAVGNAIPCPTRMPWQLRGEDLVIMALIPGALVLALIGIASLAHKRVKATGAQ